MTYSEVQDDIDSEFEQGIPLLDDDADEEELLAKQQQAESDKKGKGLLISFLAMVFVGLGNKIMQKIQTVSMQNYALFLSLYTTVVYIPISFAYIIPAIKYTSWISTEERQVPQVKFGIMGLLDGIAGIMQVFAVTKIPSGSLVILLQQAAIPVSMVISRVLLKTKYTAWQYIGASVVIAGITVVLAPSMGSDGSGGGTSTLIWAMVMVLSCAPMALSSVYKEKALGEVEMNVVYLNGWISVWQFLTSIPLLVPSALAIDVSVQEIPKNLWQGLLCYVGQNSLPSDDCSMAPVYVNVYLAFNVAYNIVIICILLYSSSNMLWLAMTIMVPLGNFAFAIKFVPGSKPLTAWDYAGLIIIMAGLIGYRFADGIIQSIKGTNTTDKSQAQRKSASILGLNHAEMSENVVETHNHVLSSSRSVKQIRGAYLQRLGISTQ